MADQNSTIKTTVVLDATQAQQEIVRLNAIATDTTRELEERVEAKNDAVALQNKLSKQTVDTLEDELKVLKEMNAEEKDIIKVQKKLNTEKLKATKASENGAKQQKKLNQTLKDSKDATKNLDDATGGLLGKMKAFITNPIGLALAAIAAVMTTLKKATERSGEASETFSKIMAKLSGIVNGLLAVLEPVVVWLGEKFLAALEDPLGSLKELGEAIVENVLNRFKAVLVLGDAVAELFKGNFAEAAKLAGDAIIQSFTGVEDGLEKLVELGTEATEAYNSAATASENLANKERILLKNRQDLEKQQLTSLRLAEEQRQIRDDVSKSFEERIAANKELGAILDAQSIREMEIAQMNLEIANQEILATGQTIENLEAVGDAELKLLEIRERITGQRSEQIVNEQSLRIEQQAAADEAVKLAEDQRLKDIEARTQKEKDENDALLRKQAALIEADEIEKERLELNAEETLEIEAAILLKRMEMELSALDLSEQEKLNIREKYAVENAKLAKKEATTTSKINDVVNNEKVAGAAAVAGAISNLAADVFEDNKAVQMGAIGINTITGAAQAFATTSGAYPAPFGPILGGITAAAVVAGGISAISKVKSQKRPSRGGGGASSISNPVSTSPATSSIGDISANNSARLGVDPSIGGDATANASNNVQGSDSNSVTFSEEKYSDFQNQVEFKEEKTSIGG